MPITITEKNFKQQVVDTSFEKPVLLDFWADWCNPCKVLTPVLEKLEKEFSGSFILGKVNTEENQSLSMMFRISSIPDVKLIIEGKISDQFMGAKPEKEVRAFLEKYIEKPTVIDPYEKLAIDKPMDLLKKIKAEKEPPEKKEYYLFLAFKSIIKKSGKKDDALLILNEIQDEVSPFSKEKINLLKFLNEKDAIKDLQQLDSKNKITILNKYLNMVEIAPGDKKKEVKDYLLCCFYFLEPEDEDLFNYRKKLSTLLF